MTMMAGIASDLRVALDPALIGERCGIVLDDWQATLIRERPKRALLCCSRQSGKSTAATLMALWMALFEASALILLVSPSLRQSGELFRTFVGYYHRLDGLPPLARETTLQCELANGSRIISMPGAARTVRGFSSATAVVLDEAARIEPDLIQALTPMLAVSDGSLIALSTPFGRQNWFAETWHDTSQKFHRVRVSANQCPRITKEFLESELRSIGGARFAEEYQLAFTDGQTQMIPSVLIDSAFSDHTVRPLWA
jgi:hypothetical protein